MENHRDLSRIELKGKLFPVQIGKWQSYLFCGNCLQAAPTLDSLRAISLASQLIGDLTGATLDDPLADRYLKLGCEITPLDHEGEDFKMIHNYLTKTFEPVKFMDGVC